MPGSGGGFAIGLRHAFNFPDVTANSRVVASVSEVNSIGKPFIGDASIYVENVAPNDEGEIVVGVTSGFDSSFLYRVTWFVSP
jgi:hypothetical protein